MLKMKYSEVMGFQFSQAMQKISSTPTHGDAAAQIHKATKQVDYARKAIMKEYQEKIAEVFGKRTEDGKLIRPEGEDQGFEPMEDKEAEMKKAQDEFGECTVELNCKPFSIPLLNGIKVSAQDLEALKALYEGNAEPVAKALEKPAIPKESNVSSLR